MSLCRLLSGTIYTHALVVFTVYPDYDFMFVFMWTVGISSVQLSEEYLEIERRHKETKRASSISELFPVTDT